MAQPVAGTSQAWRKLILGRKEGDFWGGGGVEGMGRGRVVCVSPKPGSSGDESRVNGELQAVCPAPP